MYCRNHMVQLHHDKDKFDALNCEVVVIGPEPMRKFRDYWIKNSLTFIGIPDPGHKILDLYGQEVKILKLGRMPAQVLIDKNGVVCFVYYGSSMKDIPENADIIKVIKEIEDKS